MADSDRTASLISPAKLAQMKPKAPASPAAWLTQMAADAGHLHVKRIGELGELLQEQSTTPELRAIAGQLQRLADCLPSVDFSLLEPQGWWARTSGKSRSTGAEFAAQFDSAAQASDPLAGLVAALGREHQADGQQVERVLVELEVESQAIEKIIDQGARWLQDMRNQLKLRQAEAVDIAAQQAVLEDSNRCDILVARLKLLRALCNAAAQVPVQARANTERRGALAQTLQQSLAFEVKNWHSRLSALAVAGSTGKATTQPLQRPIDAHQELRASVDRAISACEQLMAQEQALAQSLSALVPQQAPPA